MTATPTRERPHQSAPEAETALWLRLTMPSVADLLFVSTFLFMTVGIWASRLLWDTSTGWHIRNGQNILRTLSVPRTDPFSYTMAGQPWYAWEWLWDAICGALDLKFGLSGVVAVAALVIALTFALLYRTVAERSGNTLVAAFLTVLALSSASIHFLARPHVISWLLALWVLCELESLERGSRRPVWTLPVTFAIWANLHGGFVFGLALIAVYGVAAALERDYRRTRRLAGLLGVSAVATVLNPYGLKLHEHILRYLASSQQMNNIDEFLSPNFHQFQEQFFLVLVLVAVAALVCRRSAGWKDLLLAILAVASGLVAARNIPLASILLAFAAAPALADILGRSAVRAIAMRGERMWRVEDALKGHLLPVVTVAVLAAGLAAGYRLPNATWYSSRVPASAAEYLVSHLGVREHVFAPDYWGGYLIYSQGRKGFRVAVDDRSDLYGDSRFRQYLHVANAGPEWRQVMEDWQIRYALVPPDSTLRSLLAAAPDWHQEYADDVAVLFVRTSPGAER